MNKYFGVAVVGTLILIGGAFLLGFGQLQKSTTTSEMPQPTSAEPPSGEQFIPTEPDTTELRAGGSSYLDPEGRYTFLYPNNYVLHTDDPLHIRISKQGRTQQGQTEMYDGVLVVFEPVNLEGTSLESFIDTRIQESTADGTSEVVQPKKPTRLGEYPGFTYDIRGLGTSTYLAIQKNVESPHALIITYIAPDPEQLGYQTEVDTIFSTIELLK